MFVVPFDVIKTQMQLNNQKNQLFNSIKSIFHMEGLKGFWRGLSITMTMTLPSTVFYYMAYQYLRDEMSVLNTIYSPMFAGVTSRCIKNLLKY